MATARVNLERGLNKELRIGEPRNETEQKALANLVTALRAAAEARLGCSEVSKLESLLHSGEGSDLTVHTRNPALPGSAEPLKLHSDIVRISSPLFNQPQISRVQLNWTEPAAHALAIFMYTGRVVIPANLLWETYRAASEAGVRPLCVLLRTYSYFPMRLTSADHARHIRRFATQAGCSRLRALADDYLTHLANEPANITLVVPVPASWASSRVLPLGAHVIAVSFQHRPPFEHDTSSSLVLRASDPSNACIRLPCCDPETMSSSPSSSTNGPLNPGSSSSLSFSSSTTSATDDDDADKDSATTNGGITQVPDDEPVVWLYVLCARREAGVVLSRLMQCMKDTLPSRGGRGEQDEDKLSDGEEGVRVGRSMSEEGDMEEKKENEEAWRLALERTQVTENDMAGSKVACGGTPTELISAANEQHIFANGHVQTTTGSKDLKARVTIRNPSADTLSQLLTSTVDTLHYNIQDLSVYMTFPNVSAVRASLSTFSLDYDNNTTSDDKDWQPKQDQQQQNNRLTRVRVPTVEMRTVLPIF